MSKYSVIIFLISLYSVQASDDTKFNVTRVGIKNAIRKSSENFDAFLKNLTAEKSRLSDQISCLEDEILAFERTSKGHRSHCAKDLVLEIDRLEKDFQESLNSNPGSIAVNQIIEEFYAKLVICYEDLDAFGRYFNCEDEACRDEVQALAEQQLIRAIEGLRFKGMMQRISENYPQIDAIVAEYKSKLQNIKIGFRSCKLRR